MVSMTLQQASDRAAEIRDLYERFETEHYGRPWSRSDLVLGRLTDVGDLARLTMIADGIRGATRPPREPLRPTTDAGSRGARRDPLHG